MSIATTSRGGAFHWNGLRPLGLISCSGNRCATVWSNIRAYHMANGWNDVAYNHGRCPGCGREHEGRGWGVRSGANGTTAANREWHAWMVMYGGNEPLTDSAKLWLHQMNREHHRRYGRSRLTTHRAVRGGTTDCPGPEGLAWIAAGAPLPDEELDVDEPTLRRIIREEVDSRLAPQIPQTHFAHTEAGMRVTNPPHPDANASPYRPGTALRNTWAHSQLARRTLDEVMGKLAGLEAAVAAVADADPNSRLSAEDVRHIIEKAVADAVRVQVRVSVDTDDE